MPTKLSSQAESGSVYRWNNSSNQLIVLHGQPYPDDFISKIETFVESVAGSLKSDQTILVGFSGLPLAIEKPAQAGFFSRLNQCLKTVSSESTHFCAKSWREKKSTGRVFAAAAGRKEIRKFTNSLKDCGDAHEKVESTLSTILVDEATNLRDSVSRVTTRERKPVEPTREHKDAEKIATQLSELSVQELKFVAEKLSSKKRESLFEFTLPLDSSARIQFLQAELEKAQHQHFQIIIFSTKRANQRNLNQRLREWAGKEFANENKPSIAKAVSYWCTKLELRLYYENQPCNLTVGRASHSTQFRLREPNARQKEIDKMTVFPPLTAKSKKDPS